MTQQPLMHLTLPDIGLLDETAFRARLPSPVSMPLTLTAWIYAARSSGRQVVARIGSPDENGWSLVLQDGLFAAEYGAAESVIACANGCEVPLNLWTFAAVVFDGEILRLRAAGKTTQTYLASPPETLPQTLIIGGYTDAAGGHYDHTFGRGGTGLVGEIGIYGAALTEAELAEMAQVRGPVSHARIAPIQVLDAPCEMAFSAVEHDSQTCVWDFGDGTRGIGAHIRHHYEYAGTYNIRLTAIGAGYTQSTDETRITFGGAANPLACVPVFVNGKEGHACYRIPSIVRAHNGDLLAFAEGRRDSCSDSTPVIRVVSKRSTDNGQSWGPLQIVARHPHANGEYALMNPSPVVDHVRGTGRIVLLYNASTSNEWELARGEGRSHVFCTISEDDGLTWRAARDISDEVRGGEDWRIQRPTLGHALQCASGRFVHASTLMVGDRSVFHSQNALFWSDDLGETWRCGEPAPAVGLNEAAAVELPDGEILINSRAYLDGKPVGCRALTRARITDDGRVDYAPTHYDAALIDPAVQGGMLRLDTGEILFSNPAHASARLRLTVRVSRDGGETWPRAKLIDSAAAAYSDLVQQADGRPAVLYEQGNHGGIVYVAFDLAE